MRTLHRIGASERGVTSIEFAFIALPLLTLIMGSIEFGVHMFAKANLDGALRQAARMATTGDPTIMGTDGERIDAFVTDQVRIVNDTDVTIEKRFYDRFDQVRQPEKKISGGDEAPYCFEDVNANQTYDLDPGRNGLGGADDIVSYRVTMTYPALFPLITNQITGKDRVSISSEVSVRNEPFGGVADQQASTCCVAATPGNPVTCS